MSFQVGHRMVNVYGELGEVIKRNESRLKEATHLFRKAVSLEQTSAMKSHWYYTHYTSGTYIGHS